MDWQILLVFLWASGKNTHTTTSCFEFSARLFSLCVRSHSKLKRMLQSCMRIRAVWGYSSGQDASLKADAVGGFPFWRVQDGFMHLTCAAPCCTTPVADWVSPCARFVVSCHFFPSVPSVVGFKMLGQNSLYLYLSLNSFFHISGDQKTSSHYSLWHWKRNVRIQS